MTALLNPASALRLGLLGLLLCIPAGRAAAQNIKLNPTYGSATLRAGFLPDPHLVNLTAGGTIRTNLGGVGAFVANAPDYKLYYTAGSYPLTFRVESGADTTLLINLPNGQWLANDDGGGGRNPLLSLPQPPSGRYDIYVGTYGPKTAPARLIITERGGQLPPVENVPPVSNDAPLPPANEAPPSNDVPEPPLDDALPMNPAPLPPPLNPAPLPLPEPVVDGPNINLPPTYGAVSLRAGFLPDPFVKGVRAGGGLKTSLGGVNAFVAKAPDFKLSYTAGRFPLTFRVESSVDTTLLINLPDGTWIANDDDSGSLNPRLRLPQPQSGRYDIYVGTFGPNTAPARLIITERE